PEEFAAYRYPETGRGRMSDMVLAAASGYAFDPGTRGEVVVDVPAGATPGNHGYLNSDSDLDAILVAWGAGIRPGARVGTGANAGGARTLARRVILSFQRARGGVRPCPFCR